VLVAIGDAVLEDENGKNYSLGSRDALLEITGHQVVLLDGVAIAIHVNC
jgi:acyl-coenzyme A synthetase/AMP-(fatty) acid ligase